MFMPTDLMIFLPPTAVPKAMVADTRMISQNGELDVRVHRAAHTDHDTQHAQRHELLAVLRPMEHGHARAEMICAHLKNEFAFAREAQQRFLMSLVNSQPVPKPRNVEMTRP